MSGPEFIYNNLSKPSLNNSNIEKIEKIESNDNVEKIDKFETNDKVEKIEEPPKPLYQEKQELPQSYFSENKNMTENNLNSNSQPSLKGNYKFNQNLENDIPALNPQSFYQNSEDKKTLTGNENKPVSNIEAKKIAKDKIFKREPMFRLFKKSAVVLQ